MSIIKKIGDGQFVDMRIDTKEVDKLQASAYVPTEEEASVRAMIIKHFTLGYQNQWTPRREFNDLSLVNRMSVDQMSFNTYQPNNGEAPAGDVINGWRSNAIRPVVRNKAISIAAHATARLIFPKVFAFDQSSNSQEEAAKVMEDLMEWASNQSNYDETSLKAVITALWSPASIGYTEYGTVFRNVKREKGEDGAWRIEKMLDENLSGFKDTIVPVDELFIENVYESDIQKQAWLVWRKVISYDTAKEKYSAYKNWKYVKPGMQTILNDANQAFYNVYDPNMRTNMVEEVTYWNKAMDVKLCMVNGILLSEYDAPNPRDDKQYPFWKFGYELLDEGKFFYYKSLAFKMQGDANIVNTLYPLIIDGTYLSIMPPMINLGSETVSSEVIVPGAVTTLSDPNSKFNAIQLSQNMQAGMNTLAVVEKSLDESSQDPIQQGQVATGSQTAYEISKLEQNANTVLGLFIKMIGSYVLQYGRLRQSDILQYLTILDVEKIEDNPALVYKTFLVESKGKNPFKKVQFEDEMSDEPMSEDEKLESSYEILEEEKRTGMEISKVNPRLFRKLKYQTIISPDVLNPRSEDLEKALNLELFDRAIALPFVDQEKVAKDFLFGSYRDVRDPDQYIRKQTETPMESMVSEEQTNAQSALVEPQAVV